MKTAMMLMLMPFIFLPDPLTQPQHPTELSALTTKPFSAEDGDGGEFLFLVHPLSVAEVLIPISKGDLLAVEEVAE